MKNLRFNILTISMAAAFCLSAQETQESDVASTAQPLQPESAALQQQISDPAVNQAENETSSVPEMSVPEHVAPVVKRRVSAARAAMEAEQKLWENWNSSQ